MSCHHSLPTDQGFAASNLTQRCSKRISQALKHFTGKGRTAPRTKCSQGSSQQETNTPMPKKPESASSVTHPNYQGLIAGSRTSAGKRPGCWAPRSCQGLDCPPTTPLSHSSQTLHLSNASHQWFLAPHLIIRTKHLHFSPTFGNIWEQRTEQQHSVSKPMANCSCRPCRSVPPCTGTIPWNQHFLSLIPQLPLQQAWKVKLTWLHHTLLCSISW